MIKPAFSHPFSIRFVEKRGKGKEKPKIGRTRIYRPLFTVSTEFSTEKTDPGLQVFHIFLLPFSENPIHVSGCAVRKMYFPPILAQTISMEPLI